MTPSKEDYLKKIIELGGERRIISNKELSIAMNVSAASVTDMNNRLLKEKYITYIPYKGVQPTKRGLTTGNKLIRKHRLWEVFLSEKLGYKWEDVHGEAELLEHHTSDILAEKLNDFLGNPTHDPHGGAIPTKDGEKVEEDVTALTEIELDVSFKIHEVNDDKELLEYLSLKNLELQTPYILKEVDDYDGLITLITIEGHEKQLSYKAARQIFVEPVYD